jgi:uncharacterized protein with NRDE domain
MMTVKKVKRYTGKMCLLAVAYNPDCNTSLIVTSNRDEFYRRPTQPMHWWLETDILAGRDQQAGGTWLGLSRNGRFAAVTNFRNIEDFGAPPNKCSSRGELVPKFLSSKKDALSWAESEFSNFSSFSGFNLLLYDGKNLVYLNNQGDQIKVLESGVYALSNNRLDSAWPKVDYAREKLNETILNKSIDRETLPELLKSLSSEHRYSQNLLPETGLPKEMESILSSPFITSDNYGTRASTAIIISSNGRIHVAEQGYQKRDLLKLSEFDFQS